MQANWLRRSRADFIKAGVALLILVAGLIVAEQGQLRGPNVGWDERLPRICGAAAVLIAGVIAVRAVAHAVGHISAENIGDARSTGLRILITVLGYLIVLITFLSSLGVNPAGLLLGGAITGIVLGIAAQQTLSNFFAGIVLLVNRPLSVGDYVVLRSGPIGGEFEGLVTDMSLFYVKLETKNGPVSLPNAGVLASAVGPGARAPRDEDKEVEEEAGPQAGGAPSGEPSKGATG
ncbi:MAG: mechanosensitive ion channel family protein [Actinomycetota bacterium]|nr:mechanosensitive ion channel family protein [Actinomycetota bacterium]